MLKKSLAFGLIAGAIITVATLIPLTLFTEVELLSFTHTEIYGYSIMTIALSTIFFGIRSYRDQELDGNITFVQALKMGLLISLVAGIIYAGGWMILSDPSFDEAYAQQYIENLRAEGATEAELAKAVEETQSAMEMMKNPFIKAGITFMEIFPVGLIISLISAGLLRSSNTSEPEKVS